MSIYDKASLVLIPSGTKTSKVYSQKPVNGDGDFTFSRSTAATRVNADGNIEKETQNLLLQSNSFDTTWVKSSGITLTSGQAGYDGSNNAWLVERSAAYNNIYQSNSSFFTPVSTISIYAKAGTYNFLRLAVAGVSEQVYFNLTDGSLGVNSDLIASSAQSVGNGWWRLSATFQDSSASGIYIQPVETDGGIGNAGTGSIYIQDAQLEQGLVARDYIETTTAAVEGGITDNVPRLDYTDSSCPALLLEPQRTNLFPYSEYFESWNKQNAIAVNTNNDLSPEGLQNATELDGFDASNFQSVTQYLSLADGTYTFSVFLKKTTGALNHYPAVVMGSTYKYVIVNSTTGTYAEATGTNDNDSVIIESWDANWWRVIVTNTMSAGFLRFSIYPSLSSSGTGITPSAAGANVFYGAQVEEGSYATSCIPTYGTSVTRNEDACNAALSVNDINSQEGVLYTEISALYDVGNFELISLNDGTNDNRCAIFFNGGTLSTSYRVNQSNIFLNINTSLDILQYHKVAISYKQNEFKAFVDGVKVLEQLSGDVAPANTFNELSFDRGGGSSKFIGRTKQVLTFNTALNDEELAALTTI